MLPTIKYLVLTILFLLASFNLSRTTLEIYTSSQRLEQLKNEASSKRKEQQELENELTYRQSDSFVEQEARNKLNMVKSGEKLIVSISHAADGGETLGDSTNLSLVPQAKKLSNPEKWIALFFDN